MELHVLTYEPWYPLSAFGLTSPMWILHRDTLIATWVVLLLLVGFTLLVRMGLRQQDSIARYAILSGSRVFVNFTTQTLGAFNLQHFSFVTALFLFILFCNLITTFIPWLHEPTSDLNTTLALGITQFIYVQASAIKAHGWGEYFKELATPWFLLPLHITGKLAQIISISFRLFGNIFGGTIIVQILQMLKGGVWYLETLTTITGINLVVALFFGVFEGLIQAFVFYMLSLTYLAIGIQPPPEHGPKHQEAAEAV